MYVVTYIEHLESLEGLDEGTQLGKRSGKGPPEIVQCFRWHAHAEEFCENINNRWSKSEDLEGVRAMWYEIIEYPVCDKVSEDGDGTFVSAWTRFGKKMSFLHHPDWTDVVAVEKEHVENVKDRLVNESLVSIEIPTADLVKLVAEIAENAATKVLDRYDIAGIVHKAVWEHTKSFNSITSGIRDVITELKKKVKETSPNKKVANKKVTKKKTAKKKAI